MKATEERESQQRQVLRVVQDAREVGFAVTGFEIDPDGTVKVLVEPETAKPEDRRA
jgi:hypothetical protein